MSVLTVIPAKLGSTRLPQKNILPLNGKPLLHWTIGAALGAECCGEVMVSTESEKVAEVARNSGASVPFMRPDFLSKDPYQVYEVCEHVLDEYEKLGRVFETLILLLPTSPFRSAQDICETYKLFHGDVTAAISASVFESDIYSAHSIDESGGIHPIFPEMFKTPTHKRPKPYELNGAITIVSVDTFRRQRSFCGDKAVAYKMGWERSVDIDTAADFEYAKYLLEKGLVNLS